MARLIAPPSQKKLFATQIAEAGRTAAPPTLGGTNIAGVYDSAAAPDAVPASPAASLLASRPDNYQGGHGFRLMSPRQQQQALRNAGYDVSVDGVLGPQTTTAANAYLKGTPAVVWNHAWQKSHQTFGKPTPPPAAAGGGGTAPIATPDTTAPADTTAAPAAGPTGLQQLLTQVLQGIGAYKPPTTAELLKQAGSIADAELAPQRTDIATQQAKATADATHNAQFEANLAAALANVLKSQGPATEGAYHDAGVDQAAFAKGYSGDAQAAAEKNAADTNAFLDSIGAPAGQHLDAGKAAAGANVLYGLGGAIPAETFSREGAAFTAAANAEPATAVGQGLQSARDAIQAGVDAKKTLAQKLIDINATRPGLLDNAVTQLQSTSNQNASVAQNNALLPLVLAKDFDQFPGVNPLTGGPTSKQASIDIQVGNQTIALKKFDLSTRTALANLTGLDPATGKPTLAGQKLLLAEWKAKNPAARGGFTKKQLSDLRSRAGAIAHDAFYGKPKGDKPDEPQLQPLTYEDTLREILNAGVPLSLAQEAANSYWTQPGLDRTWEESGGNFTVTGWSKSGAGRPAKPLKLNVRAKGT